MLSSTDCPCGKSEADVFVPRPVQTVMEKGYYLDSHALNNVSTSTGPIEFNISGSPDEFIDLNDTALQLKCRLVTSEGVPAKLEDKIFPINNFMHSLFSNITLIVGDKQIDGGVHMYAYRSYFSNLLLFGKNAKKGQLKASGFVKDEAGKFDNEENSALAARLEMFSPNAEFYGPLWLDLLTQGRYLINQTNVYLRFDRNKPEFYLQTFGEKVGYIEIVDAVLYVRRVKMDKVYLQMMEKTLVTQNALYNLNRSEMLSYTISQGDMSHSKENMFRGLLPKFIVFGLVENKSFNGEWKSNPFNFQHFSLNSIALYKEGESVPARPLTPNFEEKQYTREYMNLLSSLELFNRNEDNDLTLDDFFGGNTLFGFNLTPDMTIAGHAQPYRDGNLRLELKFAKPLPAPINVIVMAVFDGKVEVTSHRNVLTDYKT